MSAMPVRTKRGTLQVNCGLLTDERGCPVAISVHDAKQLRDPVAPATRSRQALRKAQTHTLEDGSPTHSFQTLMALLQTMVRNTCRTKNTAADAPTFQTTTTPNEKQKRALDLIAQLQL